MARQVTAQTTPEEIEEIADEYVELLRKSNLPADRDKVIAGMEARAAAQQNPPMTVAQWKAAQAAKSAPPVTPVNEAEEPLPAKPKREKLEEVPKEVPKKERGAVAKIDPNYFYVPREVQQHADTWLALNRDGVRMHMLAVGPAGCGKTSLFSELGKKHNIPVYIADCASITTPDRWLGHKDVQITESGPQTTYVLSEFLRWISADGFEPGLVVLDEITRLPGFMLNIQMPILDGRGSIWVPELGIHIKVHPDTLFAATANIGVGFTGTYGLDQALQDRFGATVEMTFPAPDQEVKILMARTGIEEADAKVLVEVARQARAKWDSGDLSHPISTRALLNASHWVSRGRSIIDSAEATFVKSFSSEGKSSSERTQVQLLLQGLAGGKK